MKVSEINKKLGITPVEEMSIPYGEWGCITEEVRELEQQRDEVLEALIEDIISYEFSHGDMFSHSNYKRNISIIKNIYGRSWEDIKELYNA